MTEPIQPIVALAAGGTGGHVFPASALASELKARGWRVVFFTDQRGGDVGGMEDIETFTIRAGGVAGKSIIKRLRSIPELAIGFFQARSLLRKIKPDVVVGFGGYASVPTMMAATGGQRCKTAIHEQNAVLGRANRLMAHRVDAIATSYVQVKYIPEGDEQKVTMTGMPVRPEILAVRDAELPVGDNSINLLVLGGSQGARVLSDVIPAAIARLAPELKTRLRVVQQCRPEDLDRVLAFYKDLNVIAELSSFFENIPGRILNADLLITRAGASTVSEALAVGRPAILVPYPYAVDDHQAANAHAVAEVGAGWMMDQSIFTVENLAERLGEILSTDRILKNATDCARNAAPVDAAKRLADMVENLHGKATS